MTTLTVTEVLSRSIICSWVSVTAATLQISTNRLPCLSPACQAKPYSSTWGGGRVRRDGWVLSRSTPGPGPGLGLGLGPSLGLGLGPGLGPSLALVLFLVLV